jgi:hypothetical protein
VWGDRVIPGNQVYNNDPAWALRVVWGNRVVWRNRVVWGNLSNLDFAPASLSWSNVERANGDFVPR